MPEFWRLAESSGRKWAITCNAANAHAHLGCIWVAIGLSILALLISDAHSSEGVTPLETANAYVLGGQLDAAAEIYESLLRQDSTAAQAHRGLGLVYWTRGQVGTAMSHFQEALKHNPNLIVAYTDLAVIFSHLGQHLKAIEHCHQAVQRSPEDMQVRLTYGRVLWEAERYEEAIAQYREALKRDMHPPQSPLSKGGQEGGARDTRSVEAYIGIGRAHLALAELPEALEALNTALSLDANEYNAYFNRGVVYSKQGASDKAVADFQRVLALQPDYAPAYFEIGFAHQQQHQYASAIEAYQKAIRLNPEDPTVHHNLARCLIRVGQHKDADRARKTAKRLSDYSDKVAEAQAYINQYSERPEGYAYLASLYQQRGKYALAIEQYRVALTVDADYMSAYTNLAALFIQRRQLESAAEVYRQALQRKPEEVRLRVKLARLYQEQHQHKAAMAELDIAQQQLEAATRWGATTEQLESLSFVYYAKGSYDLAEQVLMELIEANPNNRSYLNQLRSVREARARKD